MPLLLRGGDFAGQASNRVRVDAELPLPHQRLAGQLEQDTVEARTGHAAGKSSIRKRRTRFNVPAPFSNC